MKRADEFDPPQPLLPPQQKAPITHVRSDNIHSRELSNHE